MSPGVLGAGAGIISTLVAAASNLRRADPHLVSTTPDLLTLAAIVAVVWFAVRRAGAHQAAGRQSAQTVTVVASTVFALGMGAFTLWYLPSHALVLSAVGAVSGFVLAYLAGLAASRTLKSGAV